MKKLNTATVALLALLGLSACNKPTEQATTAPAEQAVASETATATAPATTEAHDHETHDHDDKHDHDHEGHGHAHGGEAYQCGDKQINILVHTHDDGKVEAHATIDDIEYDLEPKSANVYHTDDGINDKDMTLTLDADKAVFTAGDGTTLLTCQKS